MCFKIRVAEHVTFFLNNNQEGKKHLFHLKF